MRVKISICSKYSYKDPPIPRSRHITPIITLCREIGEKTMDENSLSNDIIDSINRSGFINIFDADKARSLFGIELSEDQYIKLILLGR